MDDDDLVRNIASSILEQFGYNVLLAEEGAEAVRIYKEKRIGAEPVDLVIMDLTIPGGMGGEEAAVEILAIDPNAKIIVSSGYSNAPVMAHYQKYGFCGVIHKPFQVEDFISVVQKTLYAKS
ncbi:MAG: response regulator [Desulfobulbaceae bacterium]|nr:response regulator [Desulfobulbaceae bacterium]